VQSFGKTAPQELGAMVGRVNSWRLAQVQKRRRDRSVLAQGRDKPDRLESPQKGQRPERLQGAGGKGGRPATGSLRPEVVDLPQRGEPDSAGVAGLPPERALKKGKGESRAEKPISHLLNGADRRVLVRGVVNTGKDSTAP